MSNREVMKNDVPILWRQRAKAGLCPVCGKTADQFEKRMRVYCSVKCRDEYASKYTYWTVEREKFLEQHGKICDECGITPEKIKQEQKELYNKKINNWLSNPKNKLKLEEARDEALVRLSEYYQKKYEMIMNDESLFDDTFWEEKQKIKKKIPHGDWGNFHIDHIRALCNGGDMWDTSNWQVLCSECHKEKTKKDLKKYRGKE